jgi:hypothetical protein
MRRLLKPSVWGEGEMDWKYISLGYGLLNNYLTVGVDGSQTKLLAHISRVWHCVPELTQKCRLCAQGSIML